MKRLSIQLENVAKMTTSLTSTLMHLASGRLARVDVHMISHKIEEVKHLTSVLPVLSKWIEGAVKELSLKDSYGNNLVKPEEVEIMMDLKKAVDAVSLCFADVYPVAKLFLQNTHPSKKLSNSFLSGGSVNISSLVLLSGKCLQVDEVECSLSCPVYWKFNSFVLLRMKSLSIASVTFSFYHVITCHITLYDISLCRSMSCFVISCSVLLCRSLSCACLSHCRN